MKMTITTEEAEWLAKQHDLVRFTLGMKAPEHDLTATTIRSLAAERDALQARVAKLEGLAYGLMLAMSASRYDFAEILKKARAALEGQP